MRWAEDFGARLRSARERRGLTQAQTGLPADDRRIRDPETINHYLSNAEDKMLPYDDHDEPVTSECRYCGCEFSGTGTDCGGCRLDDEQCADYARRQWREDPPLIMGGQGHANEDVLSTARGVWYGLLATLALAALAWFLLTVLA